ncbi:11528_t:CDS:2, partial [Gigaspora rosea]
FSDGALSIVNEFTKCFKIMSQKKINILIGATGSVASIKIPILVQSLLQYENVEIKVVSTDNALHFFDKESLTKELGVEAWSKMSDPVLHIE